MIARGDDFLLDVGPPGQLAGARERLIRKRAGNGRIRRQPVQHDQRIVRTSAQNLRAREEKLQREIVPWTDLHRAPSEIVKAFVVVCLFSFDGAGLTVVPVATRRCLRRKRPRG